MADDQNHDNERPDAGLKPAYRAAVLPAPEDEGATAKPAFVLATAPQRKTDDQKKPDPALDKALPGFNSALITTDSLSDDAKPDLSGAGWIRCSDGKWIRDDGTSLHVPAGQISPAQVQMILKLAADKGWGCLYAYKPDGRTLHPSVSQALSETLAQTALPMRCCLSQAVAGTLHDHVCKMEDIICQRFAEKRAAHKPEAAPA